MGSNPILVSSGLVMELVDMTYLGCVFCGFESHQGHSASFSTLRLIGQDNALSMRKYGFKSRRVPYPAGVAQW